METAFVTRHTYKKLVGNCLLSGDWSLDSIFEELYEQSLKSILNNNEAVKLFTLKKAMSGDISKLESKKQYYSRNYIFKINPPKYHRNDTCKYLHSNFVNFEIPPQIKAMGPDKIIEFQEFCGSIREKYKDKPDDIFWAQVGARFRVQISPKSVEYANSGINPVEGMSVLELKKTIGTIYQECIDQLESDEIGEELAKYRYAPHYNKVIGNIKDEKAKDAIINYFKMKWKIVDLIFELYKENSALDGYILPIILMKSMGLDECSGCASRKNIIT